MRIWNFAARKPLNLRIYTQRNSHVGWLFPVAWASILASSQRRSNAVRPLKIVSSRIASRMAGWAIARDRPARSAGRKEMGRAATAAWLILRLMGRASSSNSGKSVPSAQPMAGSRPFAPKGRHVCTSSARMSAMGDNSKELSPRRKRSMIASPAKASGHRRPKGLVSRKVSLGVGALVRVREGRAASGASDTPGFPPMFWDRAGGALAGVPIGAARQICGALPRQINSADRPGASTNVIAMRVTGSQRSFSDRRATCAKPNRWSRAERLRVPSISHCAKNDPVTP